MIFQSLSNESIEQVVLMAATMAVNLLIQTTLVLGIGLIAARIMRSRGAALQSCVLRATLVATLICPLASWLLHVAGVSGFRIELPSAPIEISATNNVVEEPVFQQAEPLAPPPVLTPVQAFDALPELRDLDRFDEPEAEVWSASPSLKQAPPLQSMQEPIAATLESAETDVSADSLVEPPVDAITTRTTLIYFTICVAWLCMSGLLVLRLIVANLMMERLRRRSRMAPQEVLLDCDAISRQMSVIVPPVLVNERLSSPCLMGWLRPAVMIPTSLHPVSADVLAHELAHLRRRDCLWNLLGHLTIAMLPWQPLVWLLSRRMEQAADNVCDDYVVAHSFDRVSYARELVTIAERFPASWSATTAAVGIAEFQSCLGIRVHRILDSTRTLSLRTDWKNLILILSAALVGTTIAGFLGTARTEFAPNAFENLAVDAAAPVDVKNTDSTATDEIQVTGVVLKPDGSPAAGAVVRSAAPNYVNLASVLPKGFVPPINEVTADANGNFSITITKTPYGKIENLDEHWRQLWKKTGIAALMKGFGAACVKFDEIDSRKPLTLRLVEDLPIHGRLIDLEGKPVSKLTIRPTYAYASKTDDLSQWISKTKAGVNAVATYAFAPKDLDLRLMGIPSTITTDDEGRFVIEGFGKERLIDLSINGENAAQRFVTVATREMEPMLRVLSEEPFPKETGHVFGSRFEFVVPPSRPIEGLLVDAETGQPLAGVDVKSEKLAGEHYSGNHVLTTVSDADGRFRLVGMPKGDGNELILEPSDNQPYLMRQVDVPNPAGIDPVFMKIELHKGIWVAGKVTDKLTHQPVVGAPVYFFPFRTNQFAKKLPEFPNNGLAHGDQHRYLTDQEGNYRLVGLPGHGVVGVHYYLKSYRSGVGFDDIKGPKDDGGRSLLTWGIPLQPSKQWPSVMREIDPPIDQREVRLDFELDPGLSMKLRIVDESGKPVADAEVSGKGVTSADGATDDSVKMVTALDPKEERALIIRHEDRKIGCVIDLKPPHNADRDVTAKLLPCATITGRLLSDGEPLPEIVVEARVLPSRPFGPSLSTNIFSDAQGRFRIDVPAGCDYDLTGEGKGIDEYAATIAEGVKIAAGETKDLGDLVLGKDRKFRPANAQAPVQKIERKQAAREMPAKDSAAQTADANADLSSALLADAAQATDEDDANESTPDQVRIQGAALKPDGTPAAGAIIRWKEPVSKQAGTKPRRGRDWKVAQAVADASGQFAISVSPHQYDDPLGYEQQRSATPIAASLSGFGPAWIDFEKIEAGKPITLQLVEDSAIRGQLVDLEGVPIRGTAVTITRVDGLEDEDLTAFLARIKDRAPPRLFLQPPGGRKSMGLREIDGALIGLLEKVNTDDQGWLDIQGVGKDRLVHLAFDGGDVAYRTATVASRKMEMLQLASARPQMPKDSIYGSPFSIAIPPARPIDGTVVDGATGEPLVGVEIGMQREFSPAGRLAVSVFSDEAGRFRMMGMPKKSGNRLMVLPDDDQPYFVRNVGVPDPAGMDPVEIKVSLHRGIWIKGRVTNKITHEPVAGVYLHYYPFLSNEFAAQVSTFRAGGRMDQDRKRFQSDESGFYRLLGLAGPGLVGVENEYMHFRRGIGFNETRARDKQTNRLLTWQNASGPRATSMFLVRDIEPAAAEREAQLDLGLDPGLSVKVRVVDQQRIPIKGASVWGRGTPRQSADEIRNDNDGITSIDNLAPDEQRVMYAWHPEKRLAARFLLEPPYEPVREITVVAQPMAKITGRLLDAGEPMQRATVTAFCRFGDERVQILPGSAVDKDGRFSCDIFPGEEQELQARGIELTGYGAALPQKFTLQAGETKELGDLEAKNQELVPVTATAPAQPIESDKNQPLKDQPQQPTPTEKPKAADPASASVGKPKDGETSGAKTPDEIHVAGIVLKPDGTPAAGAMIRSAPPITSQLEARLGRKIDAKVQETTADADGRFAISINQAPYGNIEGLEPLWQNLSKATPIVASLPGFGPAWIEVEAIEPGKPITLRLVEDLTLRGQVVDLEGNPVRGTSVKIDHVQAIKDDHIEPLIARLQSEIGDQVLRQPPQFQRQGGLRELDRRLIGLPEKVVTDKDGWLEIRGLGKDRLVRLAFDQGDVAYRTMTAINREMEPIRPGSRLPGRTPETVYGSKFQFPIPPSRPVNGLVVDGVTGEALPGVSVEMIVRGQGEMGGVLTAMKTLSDQSGRFQLLGVAKSSKTRLLVLPPGDQPYFLREIGVPDSPGIEPIETTIKLFRGIWIKGRITDKLSKQPVGGVHVHYFPFLTNEFAPRIPTFERGAAMDSDWDHYKTDADGVYRLVGLPGPAVIGVVTGLQHYRQGVGYDELTVGKDVRTRRPLTWYSLPSPDIRRMSLVREINPTAEEKEARLDMELDRGFSTTIRVVDSDGSVVKGLHVYGPGVRQPENRRGERDDSIVTIDNLGSDDRPVLHAFQLERNLGLKFQLEPPYDVDRQVTYKLEPLATVTGRLFEDGQPMPGVRISRHYDEGGRGILMSMLGAGTATDQEGRFRCALIPGHEYGLRTNGTYLAENLNVRAGETIDLGDLELHNGRFRSVKVDAPAAKPNANKPSPKDQPQQPEKPPVDPKKGQASNTDAAKPNVAIVAVAAADDTKSSDIILVRGVVLKPDGSPAVGAVIRSAAPVTGMLEAVGRPVTPKTYETVADANGQFSIPVNRQPYGNLQGLDDRWQEYWTVTPIAASLKGFGPAWLRYQEIESGKPVTLTLVEDVVIQGQFVDLEGNPVRRATIEVSQLQSTKSEKFSEWLSSFESNGRRPSFNLMPGSLNPLGISEIDVRLIGLPETLATDDQGRVEIRGLGKDRSVQLTLLGGDFAYLTATIVNREMEPQAGGSRRRQVSGLVSGSQFQLVAQPSRPIEGTVVDAATGEPISGVTIETGTIADNRYNAWSRHTPQAPKTTSDKAGRFRLTGLPKRDRANLRVVPNDEQPYFAHSVDVPNPAGIDPVEMTVKLHRGIWIKGRVTDKVTHEPVAGVSLEYVPFRTNEFAKAVDDFERTRASTSEYHRFKTDFDGNYRLVGLPGRAVVTAESSFKLFRKGVGFSEIPELKDRRRNRDFFFGPSIRPSPLMASMIREINPTAEEGDVRLDFELDPGVSTTIRFVDREGNPVRGAQASATGLRRDHTRWNDESAIVEALGPDESRDVHIFHTERNLGLILRLEPPYDPGREFTAVLQPCAIVTGRLLNEGAPMPEARLGSMERRPDGGLVSHSIFLKVATDSDGRFRYPLIPGAQYTIRAGERSVVDRFKAEAGVTTDLGDLEQEKNGFRPVKVDTPAAKPNGNEDANKASPKDQQQPETPPADPKNDQASNADAKPPENANVDAKSSDMILVRGIVLKPEGNPAVGAIIRSVADVWPKLNEVKADADGKFAIAISPKPIGALKNLDEQRLESWKRRQIAASLNGFGPAWIEYKNISDDKPVVLRLVEDCAIRGQLIDLEGNPIGGITVNINDLRAAENENLGPWIESIQSGVDESSALTKFLPRRPSFKLVGVPDSVTADNNGSFEIRGIGKDRMVQLAFEGEHAAYRKVTVVTRDIQPLKQKISKGPDESTAPVLGATFKFALAPARPVEGIVADATTGEPLPGVAVQSYKLADYPNFNNRALKTTTDSAGRFRLLGMPKAAGNQVVVVPNNEQVYLPRRIDVPDPAGIGAVGMRIELQRGVWIKGRVTNKVTHEAIAGARVWYFPYKTNEHAIRLIPELQSNIPVEYGQEQNVTDNDGFYRIVGVPGIAVVGAKSGRNELYCIGVGYESTTGPRAGGLGQLQTLGNSDRPSAFWPNVMREINPSTEEQDVTVDLEMDPGSSAELRIVDEQDQPVTGAEAVGLTAFLSPAPSGEASTRAITQLGPRETRVLIIQHKTRNIGRIIQVKPPHDSDRVVTAHLVPTGIVTGRLLDQGVPLTGVTVRASVRLSVGGGGPSHLFPEVKTDDDGKFRATLLDGGEYALLAIGKEIRNRNATISLQTTVKSGDVKDLGDLTLGNDRKFHSVTQAAADGNKTSDEDQK